MTDTDKPEPPVWVGPSATLDIDALLDRMRREVQADRKEVIPMKLSEFPPIEWHERRMWRLTPDGKPCKPADRIDAHAHMLRVKRLDAYGDWNIRDVSNGSCCLGTVVATLSGKQGRAEVWNNGECWFVPRGGEPVECATPQDACALAGIAEPLPMEC